MLSRDAGHYPWEVAVLSTNHRDPRCRGVAEGLCVGGERAGALKPVSYAGGQGEGTLPVELPRLYFFDRLWGFSPLSRDSSLCRLPRSPGQSI